MKIHMFMCDCFAHNSDIEAWNGVSHQSFTDSFNKSLYIYVECMWKVLEQIVQSNFVAEQSLRALQKFIDTLFLSKITSVFTS